MSDGVKKSTDSGVSFKATAKVLKTSFKQDQFSQRTPPQTSDPRKLENGKNDASKVVDNVSTINLDYAGNTGVKKYALSVRKAAVIGDPIHPKAWAGRRIKNIFIYWMVMFVLAACINGTILYSFVIIPDIYARKELEKIFLYPEYHLNSIIGVEVVIILTCLYAFYILAHPDESEWKIGNFRWFGFVLLNGYILYCLLCYGRAASGLITRLETKMNQGLNKNYSKISPRLERSQLYFYCCGVRSHQSWIPYFPQTLAYPESCCDAEVHPACGEPLQHKLDGKVVIHETGCFNYEAILAMTITGIFCFLAGAFLISSTACFISMSMILTYVSKDIKVEQANPFFD